MYVVLMAGAEDQADIRRDAAHSLEQAFARIACLCGYSYHFEQGQEDWRLVLTDVERPSDSPEPISTSYVKTADAKRDLMVQAIDGRLKGYAAIPRADFDKWQQTDALSAASVG
jgi:hypothetical protein